MSNGETKPAISQDNLERFLDIQAEEVAIRRDEVELRARELDQSYSYANHALDAQIKDRRDAREAARVQRRDSLYFVGFVIAVVGILFSVALLTGHEDLALELLRAVLYIGVGGGGGYFYGRQKRLKAEEESEE